MLGVTHQVISSSTSQEACYLCSVVIDSSVIIGLSTLRYLNKLRIVFDEIMVASAVTVTANN
jgi:hypothetical protein